MSNNTGLYPSNGHRIQGRSSESFIDARDIISRLDLDVNEVFMDAGCGDGHVAMEAHEIMDDEATIYALDIYEPSITDLKKDLKEKGITNVIPVQSDIAGFIVLGDDTVDICLLINVFHGFIARKNTDEAITELKRVIKPDGKIAVMDYKKMDTGYGPPFKFKIAPDDLEKMFIEHGFEMVQLDNEVGEDLEVGCKSHYLAIFEKSK
ncbi:MULTISPECIES: class I SAM-dependent methyltransferase [Methanobacterium]|jgi:ubiquinone/menaquinone biosynthesis C-methylase UbiE|uniref:Methyltransferase domain-containing protein n=1 Tax=Methanobacterium subterraneum TaxID=59277 RepID=A0A7K4DMH1_9EURY|nr:MULTISPECIES: class I SAM-dependent methyltransferase [Methanobacterium]AUB58932.1 SAM-dependent methyltransferase [Methanobacterium sp. MZ-A1]NMO09661.1 methyltransferase domain-containing protein [Methanobacterium subterraneum]PKL71891.1 MAG: SAM-dependent methyltransferase [Methanobacteriales archaeon HGW-Methanobacteriales-2]